MRAGEAGLKSHAGPEQRTKTGNKAVSIRRTECLGYLCAVKPYKAQKEQVGSKIPCTVKGQRVLVAGKEECSCQAR